MAELVLTPEQARLVGEATSNLEVRDPDGRLVALLEPIDERLAAVIAEIQQRRGQPGPRVPAEQVRAHLRRLAEIRQQEPLDEARVLDLLDRMRAGEQV